METWNAVHCHSNLRTDSMSRVDRSSFQAMESKRNAIVKLHQAGNCASKIIKALKLPRSTVYNVLKRYKETGRASDRPRSADQIRQREDQEEPREKHQSTCKRGTCGSSYHAPNCHQ